MSWPANGSSRKRQNETSAPLRGTQGAKDWKYNNDYVGEEDLYRNWWPRLAAVVRIPESGRLGEEAPAPS
jgi:hypothetical protein